MGSYFRDYYCPTATQRPTIGDTKFSAINRDHMGWLKCDGTLLSTETYNLLFQVIGYQFGGSGTQFALPDARGRVPGAIGQSGVLTERFLGDSVGEETHTLTIAEMPAHKHGSVDVTGNTNGDGNTSTVDDHTHSYTLTNNNNVTRGLPVANQDANSGVTTGTTSPAGAHSHTIGSTGGGEAHNNMQPTIFIGNMFIYSGKPFVGTYTYF